MSRPTQGPSSRFPLRGCHPLRPAFPDASGTKDKGHWPGPRSLATTNGVSRPLLSQRSKLMSFPPATEMFQFAGFASRTYGFSTGYRSRGGLPHSEIPGSPIARISPGLVAACHVLHRLSVPRHPPDALHSRLSATPNGKNHVGATNSPLRRHFVRDPFAQPFGPPTVSRLGHTTRFFTIVHQQTPPAVK